MGARQSTDLQVSGGFLCRICSKELTDPKLLPCYHTFCCTCLQKSIDKLDRTTKLSCPICFSCVKVPPDGANGFETNVYLKVDEVVNELKKEKRTRRCQVCGAKNKSITGHCLICNENYCTACCYSHRNMKMSRDHKVLELVTIQVKVKDERITSDENNNDKCNDGRRKVDKQENNDDNRDLEEKRNRSGGSCDDKDEKDEVAYKREDYCIPEIKRRRNSISNEDNSDDEDDNDDGGSDDGGGGGGGGGSDDEGDGADNCVIGGNVRVANSGFSHDKGDDNEGEANNLSENTEKGNGRNYCDVTENVKVDKTVLCEGKDGDGGGNDSIDDDDDDDDGKDGSTEKGNINYKCVVLENVDQSEEKDGGDNDAKEEMKGDTQGNMEKGNISDVENMEVKKASVYEEKDCGGESKENNEEQIDENNTKDETKTRKENRNVEKMGDEQAQEKPGKREMAKFRETNDYTCEGRQSNSNGIRISDKDTTSGMGASCRNSGQTEKKIWTLRHLCQHHMFTDEEVELLCQTCDKAICKSCFLLLHRRHNVVSIVHTWRKVHADLMEELHKESKIRDQARQDTKEFVIEMYDRLSSEVEKTKGEIKQRNKELQETVERFARHLKKQADDVLNCFREKCDEKISAIDKTSHDQELVIGTIHKILDDFDQVRVIKERENISKLISRLPSCPGISLQEHSVSFEPKADTDFSELVESVFGCVKSTEESFVPSLSVTTVSTFEVPIQPDHIAALSETSIWVSQGLDRAILFDLDGNKMDSYVVESGELGVIMVNVDGHLCYVQNCQLREVGNDGNSVKFHGSCYGYSMNRARNEVVVADYGRIDTYSFSSKLSSVDVGSQRPMNVAVSDTGRICFSDHRTGDVGILSENRANITLYKGLKDDTGLSANLRAQYVAFSESFILVTDSANHCVHLVSPEGKLVKILFRISPAEVEATQTNSYSCPVMRISTFGNTIWISFGKKVHAIRIIKTYPLWKYFSDLKMALSRTCRKIGGEMIGDQRDEVKL